MAQHVEPMDIDSSVCDFDNKENTCSGNVLPRTPCTEKGYEELDVTELNMRLRYSVTPASSPMSKSYTANCIDNKNQDNRDNTADNGNLTQSMHSMSNDSVKPQKVTPLQALSTEHPVDGNRNPLRMIDSTITSVQDIRVTVGSSEIDENISFPSSTSSMVHTPEAVTPTKEIPKSDGSPILRGLKSVLNMFRPSQSPIPPDDDIQSKQEVLSPPIIVSPDVTSESRNQTVLASTPLASNKTKDILSKRNSPNRDSIVFNDDLEKELLWKDETTIFFSNEKIPIHKLFLQTKPDVKLNKVETNDANIDSTVEYMDISCDESFVKDKTLSDIQPNVSKVNVCTDSDSEFLDCETTFIKNESQMELSFKSQDVSLVPEINKSPNLNLDTTKDILDAIISMESADFSSTSTETTKTNINITVEELMPQVIENILGNQAETTDIPIITLENNELESVPTLPDLENVNQITSQKITIPNLDNVDVNIINESVKLEQVSSQVPELDAKINVTNKSDPDVIRDTVDTVPNLETVSVLSQIPLLVDPRVLLFNLPLQMSEDITQENHSNESFNALPANIPLPDDDELSSLPVEELNQGYGTSTSLVSSDATAQPVNEKHCYELDAIHTETGIAIVTMDKPTTEIKEDILKSTDSTIITQQHISLIESVQAECEEESQLSVTSKENVEPSAKVSMDMNDSQTLPELHQIVSNIIDNKNVVNTSIPDVVAVSLNIQKLQQPFTDGTELNSVNDHIIVGSQEIPIEQENKCNDPTSINSADESLTLNLVSSGGNNISQIENLAPSEDISETYLTDQVPQMIEDMTADKIKHLNDSVIGTQSNISQIEHFAPSADINETYLTDQVPQMSEDMTADEIKHLNDSVIDTLSKTVASNLIESLRKVKSQMDTAPNVENIKIESPEVDQAYVEDFTSQMPVVVEEPAKAMISQMDLIQKGTEANSVAVEIQECSSSVTIPAKSESVLDEAQQIPVIMNVSNKDNNQGNEVTTNKNVSVIVEENPLRDQSQNEINEIVANLSDTAVIESLLPTSKTAEIQDVIVTNEVNAKKSAISQNNNVDIVINTETELEEYCKDNISVIMENTELIVDEELVASENNSPFVSVTAEFNNEIGKKTDSFEGINNHFTSELNTRVSPPPSPKIVSKGYNFNFDEIEDPFSTKTKIRLSPPLVESSNRNQSFEQTIDVEKQFPKRNSNKNRRKSQPERKKVNNLNKKLNSTFSGMSNTDETNITTKVESTKPHAIDDLVQNQESQMNITRVHAATTNLTSELISAGKAIPEPQIKQDVSMMDITEKPNVENENKEITLLNDNVVPDKLHVPNERKTEHAQIESAIIPAEIDKSLAESIIPIPSEDKNTSSSEKSAYFSAGASSDELSQSKNVFNLPEIDDVNFNPFATKSKMRQSPPPNLEITEPFASKSKVFNSLESSIHITENAENTVNTNIGITSSDLNITVDKNSGDKSQEERDSASNISNATCSSKDKDTTVREIHTEDEDTVEGPFLEADLIDDKMSDFDGDNVDMMQFSEVPTQMDDGNAEGGEIFIDAEAFEFLLNQNNDNVVADSGKESLFLKFDPLFAKRVSSDGVIAALKQVQKRQSTPKKAARPPKDATFVQKTPDPPIPGPSTLNMTLEMDINNSVEESNEDLNVTVSKPMMVVNPAVNPVVTPRNKSMTPTRANTNRRSLTFTSPAIAVIDRLLSMSANNSLSGHETTIAEVNREQHEADLALTQLRELLADKEINVYNLRSESKELKNRLANLESQMKSLESISEERLKKINELTEKLTEKTKINKGMATVVEEYERTIASLIADTEQDRKRHAQERIELMKERDEQTAHLTSMEISFSDLHSKYEKSKQVILGFKANEDSYKKSLKDFEENLSKMQTNYELLKQHATSKLNHANDELQKMNRAHEAEVLKLSAMIKRKELHITSLEETLTQKTKANEELTAICDELINKVG